MIKAVCFDLGDTLIAEVKVTHDSSGQAITADIIAGAFEVLAAIRREGYKIAMIANGDSAGAQNIINSTGLHIRLVERSMAGDVNAATRRHSPPSGFRESTITLHRRQLLN